MILHHDCEFLHIKVGNSCSSCWASFLQRLCMASQIINTKCNDGGGDGKASCIPFATNFRLLEQLLIVFYHKFSCSGCTCSFITCDPFFVYDAWKSRSWVTPWQPLLPSLLSIHQLLGRKRNHRFSPINYVNAFNGCHCGKSPAKNLRHDRNGQGLPQNYNISQSYVLLQCQTWCCKCKSQLFYDMDAKLFGRGYGLRIWSL